MNFWMFVKIISGFFGLFYIYLKFTQKPKKKLLFNYYDDDVIDETMKLWKESVHQNKDFDYYDKLNELQKLKNKKEGNL